MEIDKLKETNVGLKKQLEDIDQRIILKKRYTLQHASKMQQQQQQQPPVVPKEGNNTAYRRDIT